MNKILIIVFLVLCTEAQATTGDKRVQDYLIDNNPALTDITLTVKDPNGTPEDRSVKIQKLFSAGNITVTSSSGNVGVGSTSPRATLDIGGSLNVTGNITTGLTVGECVETTTGGVLTTTGAACGSGGGGGGGSGTVNAGTLNRSARYTGSTTVNSSALIADDGANVGIGTIDPRTSVEIGVQAMNIKGQNVGIGSINPGKALDVQGAGRFFSTVTASGFVGNASTATALAANAGNCSGQYPLGVDASGAAEGCTSSGLVSGLTTSTIPMAFSSTVLSDSAITQKTSNIGIGSTNPTKTLDVQGTGRFSSTLTAANLSGTNTGDQTNITGNAASATSLAANGTNCSSAQYSLGVDASGNAEGCASTGLMSSLTSGKIIKASGTASATNSVITESSSNIGIGSATPGATLDVQGGIRSSSTVTASSFVTSGSADSYTTGNLGIGTVNPGSALDIFSGTIRAIGVGTGVPQPACWTADKKLGYYNGSFTTCTAP